MDVKRALCSRCEALSLYRSLLRESRQLPHTYLRLFFHVKFRDEFRSSYRETTRQVMLTTKKAKRLSRDLNTLRKANAGDRKAFRNTLDVAYGRKGKLWWELMEPFTQTSLKAPRIIPAVEKSRPPVYTPALSALLTSHNSRTTKALTPRHLKQPPTLPNKNRDSDSSKPIVSLSPPSKRRLVNYAWRFYTTEKHKILPPLELLVRDISNTESTGAHISGVTARECGLTPGAFQDAGLSEDLSLLIGNTRPRVRTRRESRSSLAGQGNPPTLVQPQATSLPTRFLRRRHQQLLGKIPILSYVTRGDFPFHKGQDPVSKNYQVSMDHRSLGSRTSFVQHLPEADEQTLAWIEFAKQRYESNKRVQAKTKKRLSTP